MLTRTVSIVSRVYMKSNPDFEVQLANKLIQESPVRITARIMDHIDDVVGRHDSPVHLIRGAIKAQMRAHGGDSE